MTTTFPISASEARQNGARRQFSQLQTSGWCRLHQSSTTTPPLREPGGNRQGDDGLSAFFFLRLLLFLLQFKTAVSGSMLRPCTLSGRGRGASGWIERCDSGVISPCTKQRGGQTHHQKQRQGGRADRGWRMGQIETWEGIAGDKMTFWLRSRWKKYKKRKTLLDCLKAEDARRGLEVYPPEKEWKQQLSGAAASAAPLCQVSLVKFVRKKEFIPTI